MKKWLALLLIAMVSTTNATAQEQQLQSMEEVSDARAWQAVGRLDIAGRGFCTGALIAPDVVLTAAHCLYSKSTGARLDPQAIAFLAGWDNGRVTVRRNVTRAVLHPDYKPGGAMTPERVRNDIALLKLDRPISATVIEPFTTASRPVVGDQVGVVSYVPGQSAAPTPQATCTVLTRPRGVLVTSCNVDHGASGSPIFAITNGKPRIVSVVSAKAKMKGAKVALGTSLGDPLNTLRSDLAAGKGVYEPTTRVLAGVSGGTGRGVFSDKYTN